MVSGKKFLYDGIIKKFDALNLSFKNNDYDNIMRNLKDYLLEVFPAREKENIIFEENKQFLALKKLYNLFKHNCNIYLLLKTHNLICNKSYPFSYPFRYGESSIVFGDFTNVFNSAKYEGNKKKDAEICNDMLKGKEFKCVILDLHETTLKLLD